MNWFDKCIENNKINYGTKIINRRLQLGLPITLNDIPHTLPEMYIHLNNLNKKISEVRGFFITLNFNNKLIDKDPNKLVEILLDFFQSKCANKNAKCYYYMSIEQRGYTPEYCCELAKKNIQYKSENILGQGIHIHFWMSKSNEKSRIRNGLWNKFYKYIGVSSDKNSGINNNKLLNIKEINSDFFEDKKAYLEGKKVGDKLEKVKGDIYWRNIYKLKPIYSNFDSDFNPQPKSK